MSGYARTSCKAVVQLGHHAAQCYRRIGSLIVLVPLHDIIQSRAAPEAFACYNTVLLRNLQIANAAQDPKCRPPTTSYGHCFIS